MADKQPSPSNKTAQLKTKRGMIGAVLAIGAVLLVGYLFVSKGPDLGQSKIDAQRAEQKKAEQAEIYKEKVDNPQEASRRQLEQAEKAIADKNREQNRLAPPGTVIPPPPNDLALEPPSSANERKMRLEQLAKAGDAAESTPAPSNRGGGEALAPDFVMYSATPDKKMGNPLKLDVPPPASASSAGAVPEDPDIAAARARASALEKLQDQQIALAQQKAGQIPSPGGEGNSTWLYQRQNKDVATEKPVVATRSTGLYWLAPGTVINAVMMNAVDTTLPGDITARVTQTVYDSRYGQHVVIPAGSILKGSYNSSVADGQHRVMVGFDALITPAGGMVALSGINGADQIGQSGVPGKLHTHFWTRMGIASLLAAEAVGMDRLSRPQTVVGPYGNQQGQSTSNAAQIITNVANDEIRRRASVGPNITVPPGAPMTFITTQGIEVPPLANAR